MKWPGKTYRKFRKIGKFEAGHKDWTEQSYIIFLITVTKYLAKETQEMKSLWSTWTIVVKTSCVMIGFCQADAS